MGETYPKWMLCWSFVRDGSWGIASACTAFVLPAFLMHCMQRGEQHMAV